MDTQMMATIDRILSDDFTEYTWQDARAISMFLLAYCTAMIERDELDDD